jgi:DNA-binding LacI/PurR family transcriptional regulator
LEGYKKAMAEHGLPVEEDMIWSGVENGAEVGYACTLEKLKSGCVPQAIFAQSDPLAFGALRAIQAAGLRVPEDIRVMGYDDILLASMFNPPISTVSIPIGQLGTAAVDMVCRIITGETVSDLHFAPTLTLRATT